ncbi:MAG: hypothetical protein MZV63_32965 [Marinilabiliales bacterium]|nr:hypothetical protein [Marinilabiliales bacterium]
MMAAAMAPVTATGAVTIAGAGAVAKSFPDFYEAIGPPRARRSS